MSFEDSEKASRVTLQQHYNFVMNQAVSITYDLWHIIFMTVYTHKHHTRPVRTCHFNLTALFFTQHGPLLCSTTADIVSAL